MKKNKNNKNATKVDEKDNNKEPQVDKDFSVWVEGLRQWPRYPASSSISTASDTDSTTNDVDQTEAAKRDAAAQSSGRYRGVNPLSNFIKFEAILDLASNGNNGDGTNATESYFSTIMAAADQLFKTSNTKEAQENQGAGQVLDTVATVEELLEREKWLENIQKSIGVFDASDMAKDGLARLSLTQTSVISSPNNASQASLGKAAEAMVKDATSRLEYLVTEASTAFAPNSVQDLIVRASQVFASSNSTSVTDDIVQAAERIAKDRGLDVQFAADRARETTRYAAKMADVSNRLLGAGYAPGSSSGVVGSEEFLLSEFVSAQDSRPLFAEFESARRIEPFQYESVVIKGAEMGSVAGAIYEDTLHRCHKIGHSMVANGTTSDVAWMVTDSIDDVSRFVEPVSGQPVEKRPMIVRTVTIRGFDASDETVDRERLLNVICTASSEPINSATSNVVFHAGLLAVARDLYTDLKKYIQWTSPNHKIVLNGHSIGGALSVLILLLMTSEFGADYVSERILRVYAHGSPPIGMTTGPLDGKRKTSKISDDSNMYPCPILDAFDLPSEMVYGYIQPYDPIVRFLTEYDALYPLVDDLGNDEVTLYATGPPRSLRPITRAIFQSWDGWPQFRDNWKGTNQRYQSVGIQHLLLPEPLRYLNDRFVSVNIGVPPAEALVRISSDELLPALNNTFPLDVFQISFLPQAIRSFLHHFYPAYDLTIANYAAKVGKEQTFRPSENQSNKGLTASSSLLGSAIPDSRLVGNNTSV